MSNTNNGSSTTLRDWGGLQKTEAKPMKKERVTLKLLISRLDFKTYVQASTFAQDEREYENGFNYRMIRQI